MKKQIPMIARIIPTREQTNPPTAVPGLPW
jgi:hypothetical protein